MEERTKRWDWLPIEGLVSGLRLAFNWRFVPDTQHADIASMYQVSPLEGQRHLLRRGRLHFARFYFSVGSVDPLVRR